MQLRSEPELLTAGALYTMGTTICQITPSLRSNYFFRVLGKILRSVGD